MRCLHLSSASLSSSAMILWARASLHSVTCVMIQLALKIVISKQCSILLDTLGYHALVVYWFYRLVCPSPRVNTCSVRPNTLPHAGLWSTCGTHSLFQWPWRGGSLPLWHHTPRGGVPRLLHPGREALPHWPTPADTPCCQGLATLYGLDTRL